MIEGNTIQEFDKKYILEDKFFQKILHLQNDFSETAIKYFLKKNILFAKKY